MSLKRPINTTKPVSQLVPFELYHYFPKESEVFQESKYLKCHCKRLIFEGNLAYSPYEQAKLSKCSEAFKSSQVSLPDNWLKSDTLRFLYSNNFNINKTIKAISYYINNYTQYSSLSIPNAKLCDILLHSGAFYINGRDSRFRPIVHFSMEKIEKLKRNHSISDLVNSVMYIFDYIVQCLLLPGQIESWVIIIDVSKSTGDIGVELKEIFKLFKCYYPCRLFKLFIVNAKGINNLTWAFVKLLIEQETLTKVVLIKDNERKSYFDYINPSQLETKYGGLKEDLVHHFFPPDYDKDIAGSYLLSFEKKMHILLTPSEYDSKMATESLFYSLPFDYNVNDNNGTTMIANTKTSKGNCNKDQSDHCSNRQGKPYPSHSSLLVNQLPILDLKNLLDKSINITPTVTMDDSQEGQIISHSINIFPIEKQQNSGLFKRINTSSINNRTNSQLITPEDTKMNDISIDSHMSNCSYLCHSVVQDGNCYIF